MGQIDPGSSFPRVQIDRKFVECKDVTGGFHYPKGWLTIIADCHAVRLSLSEKFFPLLIWINLASP